jgi:hypothetical protein
MESDGVITFESFNLLESTEYKISNLKQCLYKGIEKSDIKMEKSLADYFDVNLGSIDVIDSEKHKFRLEDWQNDDWNVVIYSNEEYEIIKHNMIEHFYDEVEKKEIELVEGLSIKLSKLINNEEFSEKLKSELTESKLNNLIASTLGEDWSFEKKFRDFFIWIC